MYICSAIRRGSPDNLLYTADGVQGLEAGTFIRQSDQCKFMYQTISDVT